MLEKATKKKKILTRIKRVKNKSNDQKSAIYNNIALNNVSSNVIKFFDYYCSIISEAKYKTIHEERIKILTPKQMFQNLPIATAQVKAGNTYENLLIQICHIIYSLYQAKKITEKVYNNIMNSI